MVVRSRDVNPRTHRWQSSRIVVSSHSNAIQRLFYGLNVSSIFLVVWLMASLDQGMLLPFQEQKGQRGGSTQVIHLLNRQVLFLETLSGKRFSCLTVQYFTLEPFRATEQEDEREFH